MPLTPDEILDYVADFDEDVPEFPDIKDALVGYSQPWGVDGDRPTRLIYSASKAMKIFTERDGMSYEEALEWLTTNTEGGYIGPNTPIVMYDDYI